MAFETGTATSHTDLYAKLLDFLQNNTDLVTSGENWTVGWTASGGNQAGIVLKGPGMTETDEVLVGLALVSDAVNDSYQIQLRGMTGILPGAASVANHVNASNHVKVWLDVNPMTYWFVANGRRFAIVVKISTVYEAGYAGLFLPYATPLAYPYPMFIGGSSGRRVEGVQNWRNVTQYHSQFVSPNTYINNPDSDSAIFDETQAWMLDPAGQWLRCVNNVPQGGRYSDVGIGPEFFGENESPSEGWGVGRSGQFNTPGYDGMRLRMRENLDTSYALTKMTLTQKTPAPQTFGVLDGIHHVTGFGNSAENIVQLDGVDHLVVQNVFRTGIGNYWTLGLE